MPDSAREREPGRPPRVSRNNSRERDRERERTYVCVRLQLAGSSRTETEKIEGCIRQVGSFVAVRGFGLRNNKQSQVNLNRTGAASLSQQQQTATATTAATAPIHTRRTREKRQRRIMSGRRVTKYEFNRMYVTVSSRFSSYHRLYIYLPFRRPSRWSIETLQCSSADGYALLRHFFNFPCPPCLTQRGTS